MKLATSRSDHFTLPSFVKKSCIIFIFSRIASMRESGLILKWHQNHLPPERKCDKSFFSISHTEANLDRIKGPFAVLIIGLTVALIVLILEILLVKLFRKQQMNHRNVEFSNISCKNKKYSIDGQSNYF